jgi:hypothetical protein
MLERIIPKKGRPHGSLIKMADSKGRITLGPEYAKKTFLIEKNLVTNITVSCRCI